MIETLRNKPYGIYVYPHTCTLSHRTRGAPRQKTVFFFSERKIQNLDFFCWERERESRDIMNDSFWSDMDAVVAETLNDHQMDFNINLWTVRKSWISSKKLRKF